MSYGLGRGLSSLIPPKQNEFSNQATIQASTPDLQVASQTVIVDIPIQDIQPNPMQPRQHFDEKRIDELADSINMYGLLEPIIVTSIDDQWYIVAGERRFRATKKLGRDTIQAIVRSTSELERLELALIENIQREDLNPIETAQSLAKLIDEFGLTQAEAAKKVGVGRSTLANIIRLLDLPTEIQIGLAGGKITEGHGKILLGLDSEEEQMNLYKRMTSGATTMSVRELRETVAGKKEQKSSGKSVRHVADFEIQQFEDSLQSRFGTKVKIAMKQNGHSIITIEAYSPEELQQIVKKMKG